MGNGPRMPGPPSSRRPRLPRTISLVQCARPQCKPRAGATNPGRHYVPAVGPARFRALSDMLSSRQPRQTSPIPPAPLCTQTFGGVRRVRMPPGAPRTYRTYRAKSVQKGFASTCSSSDTSLLPHFLCSRCRVTIWAVRATLRLPARQCMSAKCVQRLRRSMERNARIRVDRLRGKPSAMRRSAPGCETAEACDLQSDCGLTLGLPARRIAHD